MRAIKLEAVIDDRHELHLKLPEGVRVGPAEVIVMFEDGHEASNSPSSFLKSSERKSRTFGQFKGAIQMADNFDEPLSDSFWLGES